jgi:RNA polymerase sigma factor (sigma-70 family)
MIDPALRQYVQTRSADAFKVLVERYGGAVYAQCVRQLRDPHAAEDVTQAVFIVLARKASSLPADVVLPAWLFQVTRYACANARRSENRRKHHEQEAGMWRQERQRTNHDDGGVTDLEVVLDDALARLGRADREAIVLRYYSGKDCCEVGRSLGISPDTARRRVSRAVAKLRAALLSHGVAVAPAVLMTRLDAVSSVAPPASLTHGILVQALNPDSTTPWCATIVKGAMHMMRWTQVKLATVAASIILLACAGGAVFKAALREPASQPASVPEAQRESIRSTIQHVAQAIRGNDLPTLERNVVASNDQQGALVKAMIDENVSTRRLQNAWAVKFKRPMTFHGLTFMWFPELEGGFEVMLERTLDNLDDSTVQITGQAARVPVRFAPDADQNAAGPWRGAWIFLVNDGASWKVDLNKTVYVGCSMTFLAEKRPTSSDRELEIAVAFKQDLASLLQDAAAAVETGMLATADEAANHIEREVRALDDKYGLVAISFNLAPGRPTSSEQGR